MGQCKKPDIIDPLLLFTQFSALFFSFRNSNGSNGTGDSFSGIGSEKGLLGLLLPKGKRTSTVADNDDVWDEWWGFKGLTKTIPF